MSTTKPEGTEEQGDVSPSRRRFMTWAANAMGGLIALVVGIPIVGSIFTAIFKKNNGNSWVTLGTLDQFPDGKITPISFTLETKDGWMKSQTPKLVYVSRKGSNIIVFSSICTHLGCRVSWKADLNEFKCPCHGGTYNDQGQVIAGPPPKPLPRYQNKISAGKLMILATDA